MNTCFYCSIPTKNAKFCSRSCSASYSNKANPKRKPEGNCKICKVPIKSSRTYCSVCFKSEKLVDWSKVTYCEVKGSRKYQKNSRIRDLARNLYLKSDKPQFCANCGYSKHFEVCHIKAISDHSDSTYVSDINNLNNLIALCPNCHWELDYGRLSIRDIIS